MGVRPARVDSAMSAFGGKANLNHQTSSCPLLARNENSTLSGYEGFIWKLTAEVIVSLHKLFALIDRKPLYQSLGCNDQFSAPFTKDGFKSPGHFVIGT